MKNLESELVNFDNSLRLRKLNFDNECFVVFRGGSLYATGSIQRYYLEGHWLPEKNSDYTGENQWVAAPTFQSAFSWLIPQIDDEFKVCLDEDGWYIYNLENKIFRGDEAVEKLIEIVEQKLKQK